MGKRTKRLGFIWRSGLGARHLFISAFFCFIRSFDVFVFVAAFLMAQAVFVLVQNSSQSSPLSRMKFEISWKAWYVTATLPSLLFYPLVVWRLKPNQDRVKFRFRSPGPLCSCPGERRKNMVAPREY